MPKVPAHDLLNFRMNRARLSNQLQRFPASAADRRSVDAAGPTRQHSHHAAAGIQTLGAAVWGETGLHPQFCQADWIILQQSPGGDGH